MEGGRRKGGGEGVCDGGRRKGTNIMIKRDVYYTV